MAVPLDGAALAGGAGRRLEQATPEDTLGEFQLSVWLRENGVNGASARSGDAAAGWGGDRSPTCAARTGPTRSSS